jgi:hypothetical protein
MRRWLRGVATVGLVGSVLAGCDSDTDSSGFSSVTITGEEEQVVTGDRCAVKGNATNAGNSRARVRATFQAKDTGGAVIATSTAEFEVAPFSNFEFSNSVLNSEGQPSSSVFSNNVSCAAIDDIDRQDLDVEAI